jgi:phage shock protein E
MKKWLLNNKLTIIGAILGALGGFLYYYFIGCASGTCAITSSPINSTLYFAVLGGLIMNIIKPETKKSTEQ